MAPKRLFLTYAWKDNEDSVVDLVIQTLQRAGIDVHYDRNTLLPGRLLWDEIGKTICSGSVDGWAYLVSPNSLQSAGCREELYLALNRTMDAKGEKFPLIALMHNGEFSELPPSLRIRLGASLADPDWPEVVLSALEGRAPTRAPLEAVAPVASALHRLDDHYVIEIRPRIGQVSPYYVGVPHESLDDFETWREGLPNDPQSGFPMLLPGRTRKTDTHHYVMGVGPLSPARSAYVVLRGLRLPANVHFSTNDYTIQIDPSALGGSHA